MREEEVARKIWISHACRLLVQEWCDGIRELGDIAQGNDRVPRRPAAKHVWYDRSDKPELRYSVPQQNPLTFDQNLSPSLHPVVAACVEMPRTCKQAAVTVPEMFQAELEEPGKITAKSDARSDVRTDLRDEIREKLGESNHGTYLMDILAELDSGEHREDVHQPALGDDQVRQLHCPRRGSYHCRLAEDRPVRRPELHSRRREASEGGAGHVEVGRNSMGEGDGGRLEQSRPRPGERPPEHPASVEEALHCAGARSRKVRRWPACHAPREPPRRRSTGQH